MPGGDNSIMSNVISMLPQRERRQYTALREVQDYWDKLRGTKLVPNRSDIDPRAIQSSLEYAFVLERIAPGIARFRLAGMHLNDLLGMDVRGMPLTAMFTPEGRNALSQVVEEVFSGPQTARLNVVSERAIGRPALEGQVLLCPMASDFGDVNRILGCFQTLGEVGRQPRRFSVAAEHTRPLSAETSDKLTEERAKDAYRAQRAQSREIYKAHREAHRDTPQRGTQHLRLVVDNDP